MKIEHGYFITLTGLVVDTNDQPIPHASVSLRRNSGSFSIGSQPQKADGQGRYTFENVAVDARYQVHASAKEFGPQLATVEFDRGTWQELAPLRLECADSFIAGRVLNSEGLPVAGMDVAIAQSVDRRIPITTDKEGRFRFDEVVAKEPVTLYILRKGARAITTQVQPGTSDTVVTLPPPEKKTRP